MAKRVEQPLDKYGRPLRTALPRATALARTVQALTSSFMVELNDSTTLVQVYAISKDVYLKWATGGEDYVTSENFDEVIIAGERVVLEVPSNGSNLYDYIQLVGREAGATVVVIEK